MEEARYFRNERKSIYDCLTFEGGVLCLLVSFIATKPLNLLGLIDNLGHKPATMEEKNIYLCLYLQGTEG